MVGFGFILPVNAPQNMIAYGTDTFDAKDLIRTGLAIGDEERAGGAAPR